METGFVKEWRTGGGLTGIALFCLMPTTKMEREQECFMGKANAKELTRSFAIRSPWLVPALSVLAAVGSAFAATKSPKMPVTPKWGRFEQAFTSSITYTNPLQQASLRVQFTSPLGETAQAYGFWDGGRTWRVRFAPDQPGRWTFYTTCSDGGNTGLNAQHGEFLCTSTIGQSRFRRHGPVRVALDQHHLEHADGTPFFWLADTVTRGALVADPKSWATYAVIRASQNFTVAQWAVATGGDLEHESALTGFPERIGVNPDFFKRLDAKLDILTAAGILSAICPLPESNPQPEVVALPDDQAALLTRYVVARWGAEPVAWSLAPGSDAKQIERWKKIGKEVFSEIPHRPVVVYSKQADQGLAFADLQWVDVLGFQMPLAGEDSAGALNRIARAHPAIVFTPHENEMQAKTRTRITAQQVRQSAYWGELMVPPAGVSYAGLAVENWDATVGAKKDDVFGAGLPQWHKALFMPGAKQLSQLANLFESVDFWRLRPAPTVLASQPTDSSVTTQACPATTETKDVSMVYVMNEKMLELSLDAMPHSPTVAWFNPRQGRNSPAVAVVVQGKCQFPTPDTDDWLLVLKAGK